MTYIRRRHDGREEEVERENESQKVFMSHAKGL